MNPDAAAFEAAIAHAPQDDAPRLIYADWLLERGDDEGSEAIRNCSGDDAVWYFEGRRRHRNKELTGKDKTFRDWAVNCGITNAPQALDQIRASVRRFVHTTE